MSSRLSKLVSEEDKIRLLELPQLSSLSDDQKNEALDSILEQVLDNVLVRLSQSLTEADMQKVEQMVADQQSNSEAIKYFLLTKAPNLEEIVKEEVVLYQTR